MDLISIEFTETHIRGAGTEFKEFQQQKFSMCIPDIGFDDYPVEGQPLNLKVRDKTIFKSPLLVDSWSVNKGIEGLHFTVKKKDGVTEKGVVFDEQSCSQEV